MKNLEFIIPAQTRTIYLFDPYTGKTFKYKLNFPKIKAYGIYKKNYEIYEWYAFALNEKDELCKFPLPNTATDNTICFGYDKFGTNIFPKNESEFKESLFCTKFSNSLTRLCSFDSVFDHDDCKNRKIQLEKYFENWETNQNVKLVKIHPLEINYINSLMRLKNVRL
jgi:hypothetical protein